MTAVENTRSPSFHPPAALRTSLLNTTALVRVCVLGVALSGAFLATPAWADCSPQAANGVTAICTGTTNNQGGGAPGTSGDQFGYGTGNETGVTVTVVGGAAVVGDLLGIYIGDGTVINGAGASINGIAAGHGSANVTNSGSITGSTYGIYAVTDATVTNNVGGSIAGDYGIFAVTGSANVTNSGSIAGNFLGYGIFAGTDAMVTNNAGGSITGGSGIYAANGFANVTNSGSVTGNSDYGIYAGTDATVTNYAGGHITGDFSGIYATGSANVTNSGTITDNGGFYGIYAGTNATVTNNTGGSVTGSQYGISAGGGVASVVNAGIISGGNFGITALTNATVTNNAGGSITGGDSGIFASSANVTNSGIITGGGSFGFYNSGIYASTSATVTNNAGGSIAGDYYGIRADGGGSSVVNAGSISGGVAAIKFGGTGNTLTLAPGSVITGNVLGTGSDTFQLGGTGAATFDISALSDAAQYQGFSTFNKVDSSIWTLTGTSTFAGPVNVNGGTLAVDGDITSMSRVIVNNTGTLAGSGTAGAVQVNAGGTFAPGSGTPGSTMTVASLAMQSGAFYAVNLNPTTSSFATVTGVATLGGAKVNANFASGGYVVKQYTILNAGRISGAFDAKVINTNLPSGFKTSLSYDTAMTKAYLDLALAFTPPSGGSFSGNQSNVGNAIVNFFNTNVGIPLAFGGLTPQGLTQVSGEIGGSAQGTSFQASTQFMNIMSDPTAAGRGGAGSAGGATGYADEAMAYAAKRSNNPRDAFASFTKAPPVPFAARWSTWAMGYGGSQTTDGNVAAGTNTSSSNIYGVAVGADYSFSPDTVAGFALSGGGTNYSVVNGGTGRSDMFQLGAFVRQNFGATYLTASAAYGWQDVTTDRYVTVAGVDHLKAEFNTNSYSGRLELGHRYLAPWFGGLGVSPYAAVQITAFELPAYAEQAVSGNNTFALAYGANTSTATRSELGVRTDKSYALDGAVLTLRGRAAWAHDFNPNSAVSATFQTLPGASFIVNGAALAPDAALTTASAELSWMNGWSVAGTFEGEFSNVTRSYAGKGVVRYNW